ncbi:ribosomal protein L29 [Acrasis kona]|uniref:60S ribosomal protein L29 n=1 Tax=Acrasis kona TaxID=1008807 RepID=A0AAW2ZQA4_9EUKA
MAKSKNHTAHNQSKKNHRNGIKKPQTHKYTSQVGMYRPFLKNLRWAKRGNQKWGKHQEKLVEYRLKKAAEKKEREAKKAGSVKA